MKNANELPKNLNELKYAPKKVLQEEDIAPKKTLKFPEQNCISYYYEIDIKGNQGPWRLLVNSDTPIILKKGHVFSIKFTEDTKYSVTNGESLSYADAWLGHKNHSKKNQFEWPNDGSIVFYSSRVLFWNPSNMDNVAWEINYNYEIGSLFLEINDGEPKNNFGKLTFWLLLYEKKS